MKLTAKQERFCHEYLIDLNATQAAIRAGYSRKTAKMAGSRLMTNDVIGRRIGEMQARREARTDRTADEVIRRLWQIVEADCRQAVNDDGTAVNPAEFSDDFASAIAGIEIGDTVKIRMNDRLRALDLLAKHHALLTDRVEHSVGTGKVVIMLPDNGRDTEAQ